MRILFFTERFLVGCYAHTFLQRCNSRQAANQCDCKLIISTRRGTRTREIKPKKYLVFGDLIAMAPSLMNVLVFIADIRLTLGLKIQIYISLRSSPSSYLDNPLTIEKTEDSARRSL